MRFLSSVASAALFATNVLCQIPEGYSSVNTTEHLGVGYNGTDTIPNHLFNASSLVDQPSIYLNSSSSDNFMLTLIDLDISYNTTGLNLSKPGGISSLAKGLTNHTTHINWFATNVTQDSTGVFKTHNGSHLVATYAAPSPPRYDGNHTFVMFLWAQPKTYKLPKNNTYGSATNTSRYNFSVSALVKDVGEPVAANYFRVEYSKPKNTTSSTSDGVISIRVGGVLSTMLMAGVGAVAFALLL